MHHNYTNHHGMKNVIFNANLQTYCKNEICYAANVLMAKFTQIFLQIRPLHVRAEANFIFATYLANLQMLANPFFLSYV